MDLQQQLENLTPNIKQIIKKNKCKITVKELLALTSVSVRDSIVMMDRIVKGESEQQVLGEVISKALKKLQSDTSKYQEIQQLSILDQIVDVETGNLVANSSDNLAEFNGLSKEEIALFQKAKDERLKKEVEDKQKQQDQERKKEMESETYKRDRLLKVDSLNSQKSGDIRSQLIKEKLNSTTGGAFTVNDEEWMEVAEQLEEDENEMDAMIAFALAVSTSKGHTLNVALNNLFHLYSIMGPEQSVSHLLNHFEIYCYYKDSTEIAARFCRGLFLQQKMSKRDLAKQDFEFILSEETRPKGIRAATFYCLARLYDSERNDEKAMKLYQKSMSLVPSFAWAYNGRASLYARQGKSQEAFADYEKAISLYPDFFGAYIDRSILYANLQDYNAALNDLNKAIEINSDSFAAYANRAILYQDQFNKYKEALEDFDKAIEIEPYCYELYLYRGLLYKNHLKNYNQALTNFTVAIGHLPNHYLAYSYRANTYAFMNKLSDALVDVNKAIQLNPQNFLLYYNRANIYEEMNKVSEALDDFNTSIQLNPTHVPTYLYRSRLYQERLRNEQKAQEDMQSVEKLIA